MVASQKYACRLREVQSSDVPKLYRLAKENRYNSTNLLQDSLAITLDVKRSRDSFDEVGANPGATKQWLWIFVLEDQTGEVLGTSLVKRVRSRLYYRVSKTKAHTEGFLTLADESDGVFELGGFLIAEKARGQGLAKLLSFSRPIFLHMMAIPVRQLLTEFLLYAEGKEGEGDPYFWRSIAGSRVGCSYHEAERRLREYDTYEELFKRLPGRITFESCYGDMLREPNIHPASRPARGLLMRLGFRNAYEVEADGSVWYKASRKDIQEFINKSLVTNFRDTPGSTTSDRSGIAAWHSESGFEARYVPLEQGEGGLAYSFDEDQAKIPQSAKVFAL